MFRTICARYQAAPRDEPSSWFATRLAPSSCHLGLTREKKGFQVGNDGQCALRETLLPYGTATSAFPKRVVSWSHRLVLVAVVARPEE